MKKFVLIGLCISVSAGSYFGGTGLEGQSKRVCSRTNGAYLYREVPEPVSGEWYTRKGDTGQK